MPWNVFSEIPRDSRDWFWFCRFHRLQIFPISFSMPLNILVNKAIFMLIKSLEVYLRSFYLCLEGPPGGVTAYSLLYTILKKTYPFWAYFVEKRHLFLSHQNCSSSRKFVVLFIVSSCYCFRARGIVSVVCSIVLSTGSKLFVWDLNRAATSPSAPSDSSHFSKMAHWKITSSKLTVLTLLR